MAGETACPTQRATFSSTGIRGPSANEQFYTDGGLSYIAGPRLRNETANTFDASVEHRMKLWTHPGISEIR